MEMMMKPAIVLTALILCACGGSASAPATVASTPSADPAPNAVADSCGVVRPAFDVANASELGMFAYDANAPLNLDKTVEAMNNGIQVSRINFDSPVGGRVTGMMFDPITRTGPRPGIILIAGMANSRAMTGQAIPLAAGGAVVLTIDAPFHRRGPPFLRFSPQDRAEQVQLIKDLQRAVDVLGARPNVDASRIAYVGVSYGGSIGALLVGVERRLKAAVLVVPDGGLVTRETGPGDVALSRLSCAQRAAWVRDMSAVEPIRFVPHAGPTALLLQNGRNDTAVPARDAEALHKAAPQSRTVRWYPTGHSLNQQATIDRHDWLNGQIGLDRIKAKLPPG
jgi:dienelactone hydrolase